MFISCLHSKIYGQNHRMLPTPSTPVTLIIYPSSPTIQHPSTNIQHPLTPHPHYLSPTTQHSPPITLSPLSNQK